MAEKISADEQKARDAAVQAAKDQANQEAIDKAYNKSVTYPKNMKKGGMVSARADGVAQRGKTKGKMV